MPRDEGALKLNTEGQSNSGISKRLSNCGPTAFSVYCIAAAFITYFCVYAFRKPFTAGTFEQTVWWGLGYKTLLVAAQVSGYTISKFIGIKVVSEMPPRYRAISILVLVGIAEAALFLFAITPSPWNFIWLFVNGLPLGMIFGLVLGFLEGRQVTEALSAGLCASFIMASGVVKSVGRTLIQDWGISEYWMPAVTGLLFFIPLLASIWMLNQIPPPSKADEAKRSKRLPMYRSERIAFFKRHWIGLTVLLFVYILLTVVRSLRDDFAVEIWIDLGVDNEPTVFARSEFWVMIGVVVINGSVILIQKNRAAFLTSIGLLGLGFCIVLSTIAAQFSGHLSPMAFMVLLGLGTYIPYVAFHTTVFERMIAAFRETGTIGYLMYLADAVGYLGYVAVMVFRNQTSGEADFLNLLIWVSAVTSVVSAVATTFLLFYFRHKIPVAQQ